MTNLICLTHLVGHHSHLRLLALSSFPIGLGRSLGLISTGHDCWVEREEKTLREVTDLSCFHWWKGIEIEKICKSTQNNLYILVYSMHVYLTCLCVRCLRRDSLRVCAARSAPLPFIRWRPQERDYRERNKPAEVREARQKKPHIIREGRTEEGGQKLENRPKTSY